MSNIIKVSEIPGLLPIEVSALEAYSMSKIKELKKIDMVDPVTRAIGKARIIKGQTGNEKDDTVMADIVISELKLSFSTFSIQEICIAIEMGAMGKLNIDAVHVSPENIFKWIWKYRDQVRQEAIHKQRRFEEKQQKEQAEAKRLKGISDFEASIIEKYNNFDHSEEVDNEVVVNAAMYRHIVSKLGEQIDLQEKKEIFERAGQILKQLKEEKSIADKLKEKIEVRYYQSITESNQKTLAEAIALREVFIKWKLEDKQLKF